MDNQIKNNTEIDIMWYRFQVDLELAIREHVPTKTVARPNALEPFWFNREARKLVNQQQKVHTKYSITKSECLLNKYPLMQKESKRLLYHQVLQSM